jgi:putative membrane protein (TIGR04086 family)
MLTTLRLSAVLLGIGIGSLASTILALLVWFALAAVGVDAAADMALVAGVLLGLASGGFAAGRSAPIAHRFHGMIAGLGLAGLLLVVARLGGSPAPTGQVLLLALIGISLGGVGGILGGRRRS